MTATMLGPDILDVSHHPTARFDVEAFKLGETKSGKRQYHLRGKFTLHGVTQELRLTAEGTSERGYLHLKGKFPLKQTDYGIKPFKKALGAVGVANELTVYGDVWIKE